MKIKLRTPISTAVAMATGLIVLAGYFFDTKADGQLTTLGALRDYFLSAAVTLAAVALIVGVGNLVMVHLKKVDQENELNSIVLLVAFILTVGVGIYDLVMMFLNEDPNYRFSLWIFNNIQMQVEASLVAILAVSLTFGVTRMLRRQWNMFTGIFVVVVVLVLASALPLVANAIPVFASLRDWIISVPAIGGARGILLGVALGVIATGMRVLMGIDRPYGGG